MVLESQKEARLTAKAIAEAIREGHSKYTGMSGTPPCKKKLANSVVR